MGVSVAEEEASSLGDPSVQRRIENKSGDNMSEVDDNTTEVAKEEIDLEEASQKGGLIKPDGSINWDCPCLGGMAHGPCGEQFKDSFSCFQSSTAEPVGFDCVDKFVTMQKCFKDYPDIYSRYLDAPEDAEEDTSTTEQSDHTSKDEETKSTETDAEKAPIESVEES